MHNPFLVGGKVYLRPLERSDAATVQPWFNDPEVTRTIVHRGPISLAAEEAFLDSVGKDPNALHLGIVERATDRLIGGTGLHAIDWRNRHAGFGIVIGVKELWGKGYGAEATALILGHAFGTLNLHRVWLHVYEYNAAAMHIYEKLGFRKEGVLRQDNFRDGRYWDTIVMGMLREEFTVSPAGAALSATSTALQAPDPGRPGE